MAFHLKDIVLRSYLSNITLSNMYYANVKNATI